MANDDLITQNVKNMYKKYPYPSPSIEISQTNELLNLLRIFELESKIKLKNKKFLDAGSGSGHRITNVANHFTNCDFLGIDISDTSLKISNELKLVKKLSNIRFLQHNIMNTMEMFGRFDLILCMGVLHHLSNPKQGLKNLVKILEKDGIIFLYLYGKLGGHKRILNKELISILMGKTKNYELGIRLVRELGLNKFDYGWNLNFKNKYEEDSLIVDSLLHANEILYDYEDIKKLFANSGLYGFAIFGISRDKDGLLFDTSITSTEKLTIPQTNMSQFFTNDFLISKYDSLNISEKYRILDLLYEPNGYTIVGFTKTSYENLKNDRIKRNIILLN